MSYSIVSRSEWAGSLVSARIHDGSVEFLIVVDDRIRLDEKAIELLLAPLQSSLAASSSPLPGANNDDLWLHEPLALPAPMVGDPNPRLVALSVDSLRLVAPQDHATLNWNDWLRSFADRATRVGFFHLGAPGLSLGEPHSPLILTDPYLETHALAADLARRPLTVAIDGSCLLESPSTGTHHLIVELTKATALVDPSVQLTVVAPTMSHPFLKDFFQRYGNVAVCDKEQFGSRIADVVYRPYQMYSVKELLWCQQHSRRFLISQLDMISFSNPYYYPRLSLFHEIRNLTRAALRSADGVTFISEFGKQSALSQVGGIDPARTFLVPCGTDHVGDPSRPVTGRSHPKPFVLCLSGTFAHKNRPFAYQVFRELRRQGYAGDLLLAGSHPFYGAATDLDHESRSTLDPAVLESILDLGVVSEERKWALLADADAVLYPSIIEGFGLVPFEAAQVGTPTLAHRSSALAEILGAAGLASTWDPLTWAATVKAWTDDPERRSEQARAIRNAGLLFTWRHGAEELMKAIHSTLAMPRTIPAVGISEGPKTVHYPTLHTNAKVTNQSIRFARRAGSYLRRRVPGLRFPGT